MENAIFCVSAGVGCTLDFVLSEFTQKLSVTVLWLLRMNCAFVIADVVTQHNHRGVAAVSRGESPLLTRPCTQRRLLCFSLQVKLMKYICKQLQCKQKVPETERPAALDSYPHLRDWLRTINLRPELIEVGPAVLWPLCPPPPAPAVLRDCLCHISVDSVCVLRPHSHLREEYLTRDCWKKSHLKRLGLMMANFKLQIRTWADNLKGKPCQISSSLYYHHF